MKPRACASIALAMVFLASLAPADEPVPPPPPAPPLGLQQDWPTAPSAAPTAQEWDAAAPLPLLRPNAGCAASRIREWVRVSCRFGEAMIKGIRIIAGPTDDVSLQERPLEPGMPRLDQWGNSTARGSMVVFPVRPGDRRLIQVVESFFEGRYTTGEDAAAAISAIWLPNQPGPTFVID